MSTNSTDKSNNASLIYDAFSSSSSSSWPRDHGPCGACKFLRRKCLIGCIFAPYFDSEEGAVRFAAVHRVFGASNASKLLMRIPPQRRLEAVVTLCYEALARVRDPVYGCVAHIFTLQQQIVNLQAEIAHTQARISTLQQHTPLNPYNYSISSEMTTLFDISKSDETSQEMTCFDIQEHEEADDDV